MKEWKGGGAGNCRRLNRNCWRLSKSWWRINESCWRIHGGKLKSMKVVKESIEEIEPLWKQELVRNMLKILPPKFY